MTITTDDIKLLAKIKDANPHYYRAFLHAGSIMQERRAKYSGTEHPYYNFVDLSYRNNVGMYRLFRSILDKTIIGVALSSGHFMYGVFKHYLNIKISRMFASGTKNFSDESQLDTIMDVANYALLMLGWYVDELTTEDVIPYKEWQREHSE